MALPDRSASTVAPRCIDVLEFAFQVQKIGPVPGQESRRRRVPDSAPAFLCASREIGEPAHPLVVQNGHCRDKPVALSGRQIDRIFSDAHHYPSRARLCAADIACVDRDIPLAWLAVPNLPAAKTARSSRSMATPN